MNFDIGTVNRCAEGETVSGDAFLIDRRNGSLLIGVVDGLGHGPKANEAALEFSAVINEEPTMPLDKLMATANLRLARTRGAAAAILRIDSTSRRLDFVGVGNIHLHSITPDSVHPVCAPGIVGHRLRKIVPFGFDMPDWGVFAMCSDGISSRIVMEQYASLGAQQIADTLLESHGKSYDDATCVVVRYAREE